MFCERKLNEHIAFSKHLKKVWESWHDYVASDYRSAMGKQHLKVLWIILHGLVYPSQIKTPCSKTTSCSVTPVLMQVHQGKERHLTSKPGLHLLRKIINKMLQPFINCCLKFTIFFCGEIIFLINILFGGKNQVNFHCETFCCKSWNMWTVRKEVNF